MLLTEGNENKLNARVSDIADEPGRMLAPIVGHEDVRLVSLELAIRPLIPLLSNIESHAYAAKERCTKPPLNGLTVDQSAAIMLYTMSWQPRNRCLYNVLNATLRSEDREKLEPWFLYLKLILTALSRLPSEKRTVYRGVKLDLHQAYPSKQSVVWWGFTSCTKTIDVLESEQFLGKTGSRTMFNIECESGKDITKHSYFKSENEILTPPATHFRIVACLGQDSGLHLVQLQEERLPFPLLPPMTTSIPVTPATETSLPPQSALVAYQNPALREKIMQTVGKSIDLGEQNLSDEDMPIVVKYAICRKKCVELSLSSNQITCTGAWTLAESLPNNTLLQELSLWNNSIGDIGASCLAQTLCDNSTLQVLSLGKNKIEDEGAEALAIMLRKNKSITVLYLGDNNISNLGVEKLAKSIATSNRTLEILSLTSNSLITDQSLNHLEEMLRCNGVLTELLLDNCSFSSHGKQILQRTKRTKRNQLSAISAR